MNMCNIAFVVPTFVFKKSSEKEIITIIFVVKSLKGFGWNNFDPSSQTVAQHYFTIGPMYRVIQVSGLSWYKTSPVHQARDNHPILF